MRRLPIALLLLGAALHSQETMPVGVLRGNLVAWQGGSLSVRRADGAVYDCSYDKLTLFQRNQWPIRSADLTGGEPVEVLSDRKAQSCYVRMLSVVYAPVKSKRRPRPASQVSPVLPAIRNGYLTYSGLVVRNENSKITVKTRNGPRTLLLRPDTRYSEAAEPLVNKHVFIRAGRNLQDVLEAYQVLWGEILLP